MKIVIATMFILFLSAGCSSNEEPRIISIDVYADEEYRTQIRDWEKSIKWLIDDASAYYDTLFSIKFEINAINEWKSPEDVSSIDQLYEYLSKHVKNSKADMVAGFSFQAPQRSEHINRAGTFADIGASELFGRVAILRFTRYELDNYNWTLNLFMHEIGHLFGALHYNDSLSFMSQKVSNPDLVAIDSFNARIIKVMRHYSFKEGIKCIGINKQKELTEIYTNTDFTDRPNPFALGYTLLGAKYLEEGKIDSMGYAVNTALPYINRKSIRGLEVLFQCYCLTDHLDSAKIALNKILEINPNHKSALQFLDSLNNLNNNQ